MRVQHLGAILLCIGGMGCLSLCRAIRALGHHGTAARNTQEQTLKEEGSKRECLRALVSCVHSPHKGLSNCFHLHLKKQPRTQLVARLEKNMQEGHPGVL